MEGPEAYGDLTELNSKRELLDGIGKETLERIAHSYLDLLETSAAIYETDGSYATALFSSSYCSFMDRASRALCGTTDDQQALDSGKWLCHESCWGNTSKPSIESGEPCDLRPCNGKINIYAVPIKAEGKVIGSINFGYGTPPTDKASIDELAATYHVDRDQLLKVASEYEPRPDYIINAAKRHIELAAELMGEIYANRKSEGALQSQADELLRSNEELQQFAYIASHDLAEPLRMVSSYLQLLERRYKDKLDKDAHEFIAFAVDGAARMQGMIDDLLTYSRVQTKGRAFAPVACEAALEQVLANLKMAIEENKAVITHDPLPVVMADESQIIQLFQNLIANAIKFRRKDATPEIHISAGVAEHLKGQNEALPSSPIAGCVEISVADNGIGMDMKDAGRIFQMFQRLHGRDAYAGSGIGLAVCRRIVKRHGGKIRIASGPGKGATFSFTLAGKQLPDSLPLSPAT